MELVLAILLLAFALDTLGMLAGVVNLLLDPCERCGRPVLHMRAHSLRCRACESTLPKEER